jgi:hypothetical protein
MNKDILLFFNHSTNLPEQIPRSEHRQLFAEFICRKQKNSAEIVSCNGFQIAFEDKDLCVIFFEKHLGELAMECTLSQPPIFSVACI